MLELIRIDAPFRQVPQGLFRLAARLHQEFSIA